MAKHSTFLAAALVAGTISGSAYAADIVVEGFENSADPGGWQAVSPSPQTLNATNDAVPVYVAAHVTEGAQAGQFTTTWTVPGADGGSNAYLPGGVGTYWAVRYNVAAPAAFPTIPNISVLRVDVFNNTPDTIQFALCVRDSGGAGGLERSPFKPLAPNSSTSYEWNMSTEAPTSFVTGNGVLDGSSSVLRGMFVYTETQPTQTNFSIDVDNLRIIGAQSDLTAPAAPRILAAEQGSAPGKLRVRWAANTEPDLAQYRVYLGTDANFGVPIGNRLALPSTPAAIVTAPATQTEVDAPTTGPVYVRVTARDNASPSPNESFPQIALGANLKADGSAPEDTVILDLDRWVPGDPSFEVDGYSHAIVYNSQAEATNGRYFQSYAAIGLTSGILTMPSPSANGVVIWANGIDGATASESLSSQNVTNLTNFANGNGNLLISGIGLGRDLSTNGDAADQAFYANILKATLAVPGTSVNAIVSSTAPFDAVGTLETGADVFNLAGFATTSNEAMTAQAGASAAMDYNPAAAGQACVYYGNKVVFLGFGFESVRDNANPTFAGAAAKRATLMNAAVQYLLGAPVADWQLY
jgi:hypothetical protein